MADLFMGDCMELLPDIPAKSVDLILCDLPYGTTACKWDTVIPFAQLWEQYSRVIKDNGAIVLFSQPPFDKALAMSNPQMFRYEWIWEKPQGTGHLNAKKMPMKAHENILVFYKKLPTYNPQMREGKPYSSTSGHTGSNNYGKQCSVKTICEGGRYPLDVLKFKPDKGLHPTQKPVALLEYLVRTYTNPGETVLDNCMGSGSTGVACLRAGRQFIGMEKDPHYFREAKTRIEEATENAGGFLPL